MPAITARPAPACQTPRLLYIYIYAHIFICIYTDIHMYIYLCIDIHMNIIICIYISISISYII